MKNGKLSIALLASGGGTTAREILRACNDGRLAHVEPVLLIASRPDAGAIEKAKSNGIPDWDVVVIRPKDHGVDREHPTTEQFGEAILKECKRRGVQFIGQYGWLPLTPPNVIEAYRYSIVNQHPGPLDPGRPDFGGQGMYGRRVHCARLLYARLAGVDWTEVVAHRVVAEFDKGAVLNATRIKITPADDPVSLQERALPLEHRVQIDTLQEFSEGRPIHPIVRSVPLVPEAHLGHLAMAKDVAIKLFPKG